MHYYQKQKPAQKNNQAFLVFICMAIAALSLVYAHGQRQQANMAKYAAANNCEWRYNGTFYWDDRDYTCVTESR